MAIIYYIFTLKAWFISKLPFPIIYFLSDLLSFILHRVVGYRKKIILTNLSRSFPEKSTHEIKVIIKQYYRNLADTVLEVIKWRSITKEDLLDRVTFENIEILTESFQKGKSVIIAIGHCGNWEWMGTALGLISPEKGYAIVKPLNDKRFQRYMNFLRHRLNADSTIPFKETFRRMAKNSKERLTFNVFAADQTPTKDEINYWTTFLNQETGFFLGIEKISKALDFNVIFIDIQRISRGNYKCVLSLVTDDPKATKEFEITENYIRKLEEAIHRQPDNWLWSHRRWKHRKSSE